MTEVSRPDGRQPDQLRPLKIELGVNVHAEGSCLIEMGRTRVWITASVEDRVPPHRRGSGLLSLVFRDDALLRELSLAVRCDLGDAFGQARRSYFPSSSNKFLRRSTRVWTISLVSNETTVAHCLIP